MDDSESPIKLQKVIKELYGLAEYTPLKAQEYKEKEFSIIDKGTHSHFAIENLLGLNHGYQSIDSGSTWIPFWLTNILYLTMNGLDELPAEFKKKLTKFLENLHNDETGGFRGQISLQSHIASTYAAVMAIVNLETQEAYNIIDKDKMRNFLKSNFTNVKQEPSPELGWSDIRVGEKGAYIMHENGEYDLRAWYCAMIVADVLGLLPDPLLTEGVGDLIARCQTYEGGIACSPYGEAHAGYTYWGLAWMIILGEVDKLNLDRLIEWAANRQLELEGGFNGRINKLVDSWYSFWIGAVFEMLDIATKGGANLNGEWLWNQLAQQGYAIFCCQSSTGGFKDKPTKGVDIYHSMYCLAGTSICQHKSDFYEKQSDPNNEASKSGSSSDDDFDDVKILANNNENLLARISPIYNVRLSLIFKAKNFFSSSNPDQ